MPVNALFAAHPSRWAIYQPALTAAFARAGVDVDLRQDFAPEAVDYIIYAPNSDLQDFRPYTRAKAVLNLWAGVEKIVGNTTLTQPLARMVDAGMTDGMVEWVLGHVMRHHLGMDQDIVNPTHRWQPHVPPLARDRPVTVLGLGELGTAAARAIAQVGFPVTGWSRSPKSIPGLTTHAGPEGLTQALKSAQILVLLLPDTPATTGILKADTLAMLPRGAMILNPGRGPLIDDDALIAALDSGQIGHATLDVFRTEPLPADHPFWRHPKVTVTPHIASETRPGSASDTIAENIRRGEAGEPFLYLVDRSRGY
ncbi:MAG: glyoxylate/hydroxypyruvate reductase A [Marinibacterium sp.]|nr:glyoxylate/hydroxypyruvate reductase A [Marinibacterium sp.]